MSLWFCHLILALQSHLILALQSHLILALQSHLIKVPLRSKGTLLSHFRYGIFGVAHSVLFKKG
jgi:hypothetical protein